MLRFLAYSGPVLAALVIWLGFPPSTYATDYFLTIGGGYNRTGNQASLEANVIFFQQILEEKHPTDRDHTIFFADGNDSAADLQVLVKNNVSLPPATQLLAALHRRRNAEERIEYRNHRVPDISGALDPGLIKARIESIARSAKEGDRLIVYVTAHGSEANKVDPFNTTIDCWNEKRVTARAFAQWLDHMPTSVPVVMVMAQCFCGGFGHTIFSELNEKNGLSPKLRVGFFAQRHDLPAAGCRPDISNDAEFSSYFWGAIAGRSRTGVAIESCDINSDGVVSFAEAYAHAVIDSPTIDIPLRTSDVLLRKYSRLPGWKSEDKANQSASPDAPADASAAVAAAEALETLSLNLSDMKGPLKSLAPDGSVPARIVMDLSRSLGFAEDDDVSAVQRAYDDHRRNARRPGRGPGPGGGRRPGSGRRELLNEVAKKWPELADPEHWQESALLRAENQDQLYAEMQDLPGFKAFDQRRRQGEEMEEHELRDVKFRRLISTLESVVLEKNLPLVATPDIVDRYRLIIELEQSSLVRQGR